jgi:hypothetical protein
VACPLKGYRLDFSRRSRCYNTHSGVGFHLKLTIEHRNEQIDLRSDNDVRECQSAKICDEFGPETAAALRRFNRPIERQGTASRFCGNEDDVIDVGPDGINR